jgi:hypothetical protein
MQTNTENTSDVSPTVTPGLPNRVHKCPQDVHPLSSVVDFFTSLFLSLPDASLVFSQMRILPTPLSFPALLLGLCFGKPGAIII